MVRRAIGDAVGLTIKGQLRRASENLRYEADLWRVREAFYGRAGGWSAAALDDLRQRFAAWRARAAADGVPALAERIAAVQELLGRLTREVEALEKEVGRGDGRASDA